MVVGNLGGSLDLSPRAYRPGPPPFPSGFRPPLDTLIHPRTPKERLRPEMEGGHEKKMGALEAWLCDAGDNSSSSSMAPAAPPGKPRCLVSEGV